MEGGPRRARSGAVAQHDQLGHPRLEHHRAGLRPRRRLPASCSTWDCRCPRCCGASRRRRPAVSGWPASLAHSRPALPPTSVLRLAEGQWTLRDGPAKRKSPGPFRPVVVIRDGRCYNCTPSPAGSTTGRATSADIAGESICKIACNRGDPLLGFTGLWGVGRQWSTAPPACRISSPSEFLACRPSSSAWPGSLRPTRPSPPSRRRPSLPLVSRSTGNGRPAGQVARVPGLPDLQRHLRARFPHHYPAVRRAANGNGHDPHDGQPSLVCAGVRAGP